MTADMAEWCQKQLLQSLTLLLTEAQAETSVPFPSAQDADLATMASLPCATIVRSRISQALVEKELSACPKPCRIVISGPAAFNSASKHILQEIGIDAADITVLNA